MCQNSLISVFVSIMPFRFPLIILITHHAVDSEKWLDRRSQVENRRFPLLPEHELLKESRGKPDRHDGSSKLSAVLQHFLRRVQKRRFYREFRSSRGYEQHINSTDRADLPDLHTQTRCNLSSCP